MKKFLLQGRRDAFSLVEILIALGLFAVAISALLALFPVALHTERESEAETRATLIASGVMDSLAPADSVGSLRIATSMSNGLPVWESLSTTFGKSTNVAIAYTASCEPIFKLTAKEATNPLRDPRAAALVTVSLTQKPSQPGMLSAEISVGSPASAPAPGRSTQWFVRLLSIP